MADFNVQDEHFPLCSPAMIFSPTPGSSQVFPSQQTIHTPNRFFGLGNHNEDIDMGDDSGDDSDGPIDPPPDGNANPVIEALTRKFRSDAWKEYVPMLIDGEVGAGKCKHCDRIIRARRGAGTSSLRKHLKRCKKRISALKVVGNLDSNSFKYLTLAHIARDVLAWPASTVASESAFSTGSRVVSDFRCSLTMDSIEALICF